MYTLTLILLQGLRLAWPASAAPPLGMSVHVVPLDSSQGRTVRAYFTAITSGACSKLTGLCAVGDDCFMVNNTVPFSGSNPGSGWCSHHWQTTLASSYAGTIALGSTTAMYVSLKADPVTRANSSRLNRPAFVGLPPPLRAHENCPHHFPLSVKDLDGDEVRCRLASASGGECVNCEPHSFIELEQDTCTITFTGNASAGVYYVYLMAEDLAPVSKVAQGDPMSAVPFILSLTVEKKLYSCSAEPVATPDTLAEDTVLYILPFHQQTFTVDYDSEQESVTEIAVVGPPELYRTGFISIGPLSSLTMAWVRSENKLALLLPICFTANTNNLQSEPRCVWLYQREIVSLPTGTVLTCEKTQMTLLLPISSFSNINLSELQLNSPSCPISYNSTYLTATIPLEGCGTRAVHSGHELIYTNTLQTVRSYTKVIRRAPTLVLPLACRIPGIQAKGPNYKIAVPAEKEVFGNVKFRLEFYFPGTGPLGKYTNIPVFKQSTRRARREVVTTTSASVTPGAIGSKINMLDLYVTSNCTVDRAEILVSSCEESETEDFAVTQSLLDQGCMATTSALEVVTTATGTKVYRLDLSGLSSKDSTMYIRCTVNLCITTLPSQTCPDLCTTRLAQQRTTLVNSVFSQSYVIKSDAVSLVYTTPPPSTASTTTTTTTTTTKPATGTTTASHAPEKTSSMAVELVLVIVSVFLQYLFLS